jgi:hypothetical protein
MMHMHASPKIDYLYCAAIKQITVSLFPKIGERGQRGSALFGLIG